METIRVLLVDDHHLFRAGLRALLEIDGGIAVVGEAGTGEAAVAEADRLVPDVVLMDISLPGIDGLEATRRVIALGGGTRVLVLTADPEEKHLHGVLQAGGSGYVTKDRTEHELIEAIRTVADDNVYLSPAAARILLETFRAPAPAATPSADLQLDLLSAREREVLIRTAEGYTANEIAAGLEISPKTVDTYRQRVMDKLHLHRRRELVQFALREGLLSANP